ncbi:MAG TPA: hypothetical protein VEL71_07110 [Candidatus Dormibacteraeota bacterium]|nr:hypothetical protein [Candidatus Dormibacteraeota bacterium]
MLVEGVAVAMDELTSGTTSKQQVVLLPTLTLVVVSAGPAVVTSCSHLMAQPG